ncbi:MAG: DUF4442 domain-containing protein [Oceanospirillaceae bacterium]|nr:DUF4442 domain-containing protein [Oceanospirillaceae bacterium]
MKQSLESRVWRWFANWYPAYRGSGARIHFVAHDFRHVIVRLPCNWRTKNHMGITWGGSLYAALDPIYAIMLNKNLGWHYRVIDSAASIEFLKPGKQTLFAHFTLSAEQIEQVRHALLHNAKTQLELKVSLQDTDGQVYVNCYKTLHINHKFPLEVSNQELSR